MINSSIMVQIAIAIRYGITSSNTEYAPNNNTHIVDRTEYLLIILISVRSKATVQHILNVTLPLSLSD